MLPKALHPKYRPDIDGLRAIAVLAVVIFHAFPSWLKGGFIGVDIFFVISGFLISTIIFQGLDKGSFSFSEFFTRRIKRIFPALFLVLISCYVFGWFALLADEYAQLGKHIAAGAGFVSNLVFWSEAGYFDNSAETKPLLHLWSLGIEEQFYMIWPLLLWLAWKKNLNLLTITITLGIFTFYLNLKGINKDIIATFYSPLTRLWELLSGSLLAWLFIYKKSYSTIANKLDHGLTRIIYRKSATASSGVLANSAAWLGLLLLIYGLFKINNTVLFPGKWAALPVLSAVLIIAAGPNAWVNQIILSNRLVVWFGLISFPLYLWHWPLLAFSRIIESETPHRNIRIGAVAISILLAWLTYRLIEKPIRLSQSSALKTSIFIILMAAIGACGYYTYTNSGLTFRAANRVSQINQFDFPYKESCQFLTGETYGDDWCNKGTSIQQKINTVMLGDSFANAYSPMLNAYAATQVPAQFSFVQFGRGQCPSLLDYGPINCRLISQKIHATIAHDDMIKTVILAANWQMYFLGKDFYWVAHKESAEAFKVALEKTIHTYKKMGKRVIILLSPPIGANPKSCVIRQVRLTNKNTCHLSAAAAHTNDGSYREYIVPLAKKLEIPVFDPFTYFCDKKICKTTDGNKILSIDGGHMSVFGGKFLAEQGQSQLDLLFNN